MSVGIYKQLRGRGKDQRSTEGVDHIPSFSPSCTLFPLGKADTRGELQRYFFLHLYRFSNTVVIDEKSFVDQHSSCYRNPIPAFPLLACTECAERLQPAEGSPRSIGRLCASRSSARRKGDYRNHRRDKIIIVFFIHIYFVFLHSIETLIREILH